MEKLCWLHNNRLRHYNLEQFASWSLKLCLSVHALDFVLTYCKDINKFSTLACRDFTLVEGFQELGLDFDPSVLAEIVALDGTMLQVGISTAESVYGFGSLW